MMAQCSSESHEAQVTQVVREPFDSSLGLNLMQLPRAKEETSGGQVHPQVKFEHII
jgi:hypothetical protein